MFRRCHATLQPSAAPVSADPPFAADRLTLCVEILKDGYADAFTQFFSLSHPPEPETDAAAAAPAAAPALDLATVKEKLMEAEESARRGDPHAPRARTARAPAPPTYSAYPAPGTVRPATGTLTPSLFVGQAATPPRAART